MPGLALGTMSYGFDSFTRSDAMRELTFKLLEPPYQFGVCCPTHQGRILHPEHLTAGSDSYGFTGRQSVERASVGVGHQCWERTREALPILISKTH